jgi:ABC-type multidrug transport system fused ATPase/permease subunit
MEDGEYDKDRLDEAIKDAQLEDFLGKQSDGLNTILSPDTVSKGEGQRISIARIFYRKAKIILLDEITSALDPQSEIGIIQAVKKRVIKEKQIVLCISHRVFPLSIADEVLFFADGKIQAREKHEILLETNDTYKALLVEVPE